jgi:hypothetical protein
MKPAPPVASNPMGTDCSELPGLRHHSTFWSLPVSPRWQVDDLSNGAVKVDGVQVVDEMT